MLNHVTEVEKSFYKRPFLSPSMSARAFFICVCDNRKKEGEGMNQKILDAKQNVTTISVKLDKEYTNIECPVFFTGKNLILKKISFLKKNKDQKINNVIPYDLYPYAHLSRDYIGKIFVLEVIQ